MITVQEAKERFRGVVIPLVTIFAEDGSLDLESTASHVQWIIDRGAKRGNTILLAAGSGGDFSVLSTAERMQVIGAIAEVNAAKLPIMAGVQSTDIRTTIDLCQFCEEHGIDAAQIGGPYYYDGTEGDYIAWFEEVARHTQVGFAIYNHWYTGPKYDVPVDLVDRLLDIPNSVAVKWSSPNFHIFYSGIKRLADRAAVVDNTLFAVFSHILGLRAWISHVPNFYPEFAWRVWDLMEEGRYVEAQQVFDEFMVPYFNLVGPIQAATAGEGVFVRVAMEAAGLHAGHSRLPSRDLVATPEIRDGFKQLIDGAAALVS